MAQYYVKKRSIHSFIHWVTRAHDCAILHYSEAEEILNFSNLSFEHQKELTAEKERAKKYLDEYDEFVADLNKVELLVLKHIVKYDNDIKGMDHERYSKIKLSLYVKWCRKYMPSELVYVHELDTKKLGELLKEARIHCGFTRKSVADFLVISESSMKMYEFGERTPKLNVLHAFCELYNLNIKEIIDNSLI